MMKSWDTESPGLHHHFGRRTAARPARIFHRLSRPARAADAARRRRPGRLPPRAPGARRGRLGTVRRTGRRQPPAVPDARRPLRRQLRRARRPDGLGRPVRRLPAAVSLLRRAHGRPLPPRAGRCAQRPLGRRQRLHHAVAAQAGDLVHPQPAQPRRTGRRRQPRDRIPLQPRRRTAPAAGVPAAVRDRQRRRRPPPRMAARRSAQRNRWLPGRAGKPAAPLGTACRSLSLDSYLDEVQLQHAHAIAGRTQPPAASARDGDRFSVTRTFETLLDLAGRRLLSVAVACRGRPAGQHRRARAR